MSHLICLASDTPLEALPNPHLKLLSVNEALEQGLTVPRCMLEDPELDPDEPGTYLWSDIRIEFDPLSEALPPEPEDNFDIWPIEGADSLQTDCGFLAEIEWSGCTPVRAEMLADYIRRHLEKAESVELWNLWQGSDAEQIRVCREEIRLAELTPEKLAALCEKDTVHPVRSGGIEQFLQYCLCITR